MQSKTAINLLLLILPDPPEFPRKLTIAGIVKMCGNEAMVISKRFDGNWGHLYAKRDLPHSNIFLLSKYHLFYLEVNLMPYGFLLFMKTNLLVGRYHAWPSLLGGANVQTLVALAVPTGATWSLFCCICNL